MTKTVEVEFEIQGVSPLKMDKWIEGQQPKNDEGYREQAKEKVYRNGKGIIVIPANSVKACMRLASSEVGKKMEAKRNRQTIQSAVFIENDLSLERKDYDEIVKDIVTRKIGKQDTRIAVYRPLIKNWKAKGTINLFSVPIEFVRECLELGGLRYGLLSHRPDFGRFVITKFKVK